VEQIRVLGSQLPVGSAPPLFVFDADFDSAQLTQGWGQIPAAVLVRLRADRCFYADPPPATPSPKGGRPRMHGAKFACKDPATWPAPTAEHVADDEQYGTVRVRAWAGLPPKQQAHPARGTRKTREIVRGTVVLVEVSRLPRPTRKPQVLWLWWAGPDVLDLDLLWRAYVRRFDLEPRRCVSARSVWAGRRPACATRSKPIPGPGWSWPPIPSCGWHGPGWPIAVCPGSDRSRSGG
jgi:DDE superfamily endonuclease